MEYPCFADVPCRLTTRSDACQLAFESKPGRRLNVAGKQGLRLSSQLFCNEKGPMKFTKTEHYCCASVNSWNPCNA